MSGPIPPRVIVCLLAEAVEFDQPKNDLVAWWFDKPDIDAISNAMGIPIRGDHVASEDIVGVVQVWMGVTARVRNVEYRLQNVWEGKPL